MQQEQPAGGGGAAAGGLEEVVVTAQKRSENLQDVPISIQALNTEKLEQLSIVNIDDYVKYLSGVTTVKGLGQGGTGIGTTHMYMRGVVSGQDGNHSGSQPSVGTYLDEQPVTTIDGTVDIHIYDIARIEVLEGPQGTLYGASSEAGTIRIITNKPDPTTLNSSFRRHQARISVRTTPTRLVRRLMRICHCRRSRRFASSPGMNTMPATFTTSRALMSVPVSSTAYAPFPWAPAVRAQ